MSPVYFCDRNLGKRFGEELRQQGLAAELHDDHFSPDTPDQDLLRQVAAQGWVILTLDKQMRYRPAEKAAILRYQAKVIMLPLPKNPEKGWFLLWLVSSQRPRGKSKDFFKRPRRRFWHVFASTRKRQGRSAID